MITPSTESISSSPTAANEGLQKLDPHKQSGGERSVATALYMLALQVFESLHETKILNLQLTTAL